MGQDRGPEERLWPEPLEAPGFWPKSIAREAATVVRVRIGRRVIQIAVERPGIRAVVPVAAGIGPCPYFSPLFLIQPPTIAPISLMWRVHTS